MGCHCSTGHFPAGSSISKEFRKPRCSPTQSPSGTSWVFAVGPERGLTRWPPGGPRMRNSAQQSSQPAVQSLPGPRAKQSRPVTESRLLSRWMWLEPGNMKGKKEGKLRKHESIKVYKSLIQWGNQLLSFLTAFWLSSTRLNLSRTGASNSMLGAGHLFEASMTWKSSGNWTHGLPKVFHAPFPPPSIPLKKLSMRWVPGNMHRPQWLHEFFGSADQSSAHVTCNIERW